MILEVVSQLGLTSVTMLEISLLPPSVVTTAKLKPLNHEETGVMIIAGYLDITSQVMIS
jgi:hypothetical protein